MPAWTHCSSRCQSRGQGRSLERDRGVPLSTTGIAARDARTLHRQRVLPIAFDGLGCLEVDLLCADARVAVELDGAQHLADPVAYRRDRRKDRLLQERGYLVLRFLAEDVGTELDTVLDDILRALTARRGRRA